MGTDESSAITEGFETAQCIHLKDKPVVNEDFFKCGVIHELLPGERVTGLCQTKTWKKCEYIYDPTRAHREGKWTDIVGLSVVKKRKSWFKKYNIHFYFTKNMRTSVSCLRRLFCYLGQMDVAKHA